ncbi:hypothetical protein AOC05_05055 [Arthrobacter alpinus]|uniref:Uncharacterized protein n=1 Tax=Arthrobacter alpinus TaxID=656366 RepID=A0A0M4QP43_9MICC|nr:hypothetical protein [Arthrobacter alpinus]ALE91841.1 hypothetical protein AOC05_05055 [Arthrobacter alpinus]
MTIQHNGQSYEQADLLPFGHRVNPEVIAAGFMEEIALTVDGEERHLPLFTAAGIERIKGDLNHPMTAEALAPEQSNIDGPTTHIIVDDNGIPNATIDVGQIQDDAMDLAFALAAACGDEPKTEEILAGHIRRHTTHGLPLVLVAAIKHMTNDILAGAFDVMEAATGTKPREKMAEIREAEMPK